MAFTLYTSADAGAPALDGTAGSLQALLYACLVTGYGAKLAAGWSRPWLELSGNIAVFKPNDPQDAFYYVNDNGPGVGTFKEARIHMGMTHDGAGTLGITAPQNIGYPAGYFVRKSALLSTLAREWYMYADGKTAYLMINPGDTSAGFQPHLMGKALALSPLEAYPWLIAGKTAENTSASSFSYWGLGYWHTAADTGKHIASPVQADGSGTASALLCAALSTMRATDVANQWGVQGPGAPGPRTGILPMWDGLLVHDKEPRLRLRGLWSAYAAGGLVEPDTWTATINGVSRSFVVRRLSLTGIAVFETSDTLDL